MFRRFARQFYKLSKFQYTDPFQFALQLTEEERLVQKMAHDFSKNELYPAVTHSFRHEMFDTSIVKKMGEAGLLGPTIQGYGCSGTNYVSYGLIAREIERIDSGYRSVMSVQSSLVMRRDFFT